MPRDRSEGWDQQARRQVAATLAARKSTCQREPPAGAQEHEMHPITQSVRTMAAEQCIECRVVRFAPPTSPKSARRLCSDAKRSRDEVRAPGEPGGGGIEAEWRGLEADPSGVVDIGLPTAFSSALVLRSLRFRSGARFRRRDAYEAGTAGGSGCKRTQKI